MGDVAKNLRGQQTERVEPPISSDTVRRAIDELLESVPFDEPCKPASDAPEWPRNLADLGDEELGEHMSYWTAMVAYAAYQVAIQDADRRVMEWRRDRIYAETLAGVYETNATVAKAQADIDPDVVAAGERHFEVDARYRIMQAVLHGFESRYQCVSREITRRMSQRERKV